MKTENSEIINYVASCWDKVEEYRTGVKNETFTTNQYIKSVIEWFRETPEYEIKVKKVDRIFRFLSLVNILYDEIGYKRIELMPWQAFYLAMLFGMYYRGTNKRRFRETFAYMGRGNGKSPLGDAIAPYFLLGYKQISPEAIIVSTVENRNKIIKDLHNIIMNSPELHQYLHFNNGAVMLNTYDTNIKRGDRPIKFLNDVGGIKVVPDNDKKIDGLNLVFVFMDELHLLKDEQVFRNAQKSAGKRKDSLIMMFSTAGFSTSGFCVDRVEYSKKVALGEINDEGFLPFLYCLDKDDDIEDIGNKKLWYKCNPSLGVIKSLAQMEKYYNDSKFSPKAKADFKTKDLNIFIDYNDNEVLSAEDRLKAFQPVNLEKWRGKDCYLGLDLSKSNDLTSLVCLFHDERDDKFEAYPFYWVGNDSKLLIRKTGENLNTWIPQYITKCPDKYIDYRIIADKIEELTKEFNVVGIGYDPSGWKELEKLLENIECGERFVVKQWGNFMSPPLSKILISILSEKLIFSDNPVMLWNWKNARIRVCNTSGDLKIYKNEGKESQDGAVALNDAMALYFHQVLDGTRQAF